VNDLKRLILVAKVVQVGHKTKDYCPFVRKNARTTGVI
jgi:hypothetical protein